MTATTSVNREITVIRQISAKCLLYACVLTGVLQDYVRSFVVIGVLNALCVLFSACVYVLPVKPQQTNNRCWCGNDSDKIARHGESDECTDRCDGDESQVKEAKKLYVCVSSI